MRIPSISLLLPGVLVVAACGGGADRAASRDLTLLDPANETTTGAVVSAREMGLVRTETGVTKTAASVRRLPAPARARAVPAAVVPEVQPAPTPTPDEDAGPVAGGAGQALEPGQTVTVVPATSAGVQHGPDPGSYTEPEGMRNRRRERHGDRCIPGRGEVLPQDPDHFPGRGSIPDGFRLGR